MYGRAIGSTIGKYLPGTGGWIMDFVVDPAHNMAPTKLWRAEPDGYTLSGMFFQSFIITQLRIEAEWDTREFTPIGGISRTIHAICVPADSPYQTIDDFKNADRIRWASYMGSSGHLESVLIAEEFGIESTHVGFEGYREMVVATMKGDTDATVNTVANMLPFAESGDVRVLTIIADERDPRLPDVPTGSESGLEFASPIARSDIILAGPPGMPKDITNLLTDALQKSVEDEDLIAWSKRAKRPLYWMPPDRVSQLINDSFPLYEKYLDFLKK